MDEKVTTAAPATEEKYTCERCGKRMQALQFYRYRDGTVCELCKSCLTAHLDAFEPQTFVWILEKLDVPYVSSEWNKLRNAAYDKDPKKVNGTSVIGKYLSKMRLKQFNKYTYADSEALQAQLNGKEEAKRKEKQEIQQEFKNGQISAAQYKTLMDPQLLYHSSDPVGNAVTGEFNKSNPFQQSQFLPESELIDPGAELDHEDKIYLAMKWGRLYTPGQWVVLEQLYKQFMNSFDIQGAARIDTLKMICKTSLKMNEAIDMGDIETYQKLSRVYDSMMKAAKFTEAQNKDKTGSDFDSVSAIVDYVEANSGAIPRYECKQPQDLIDKIILDLKEYNKNLIYEDKALAQQIEKYLQDRRNAESMRRDSQAIMAKGQMVNQLQDQDYIEYKDSHKAMVEHDQLLTEQSARQEYLGRRVNPT